MEQPPFYVFVSHSSVSNPSSALGHPNIQYHYADDPALSLIPQYDEHVLVLDFDSSATTVKSLSKHISIAGLKVEDAPGAAVAEEGEAKRNPKMYIIETNAAAEPSPFPEHNPQNTLAQFKRRNAVLRKALTPIIASEPPVSPLQSHS
ncbi:hypothetical protein C8J56DRAFT_1041438 [Mycena floridula]|nr:hypothetical protein C8J56DRAFT_1041438 [Mycena floridula]